jgi:hypothetical protein
MKTLIIEASSIFGLLTFIHFFVDWLFQNHSEAMVKHENKYIRAKHCLIYTLGFIPILLLLEFSLIKFIASILILFISHFIEDTYIPVFLWVKHIRKPPEFGLYRDRFAFELFIREPLGKILMIVVDQIIHLTFLWPVAIMAVL